MTKKTIFVLSAFCLAFTAFTPFAVNAETQVFEHEGRTYQTVGEEVKLLVKTDGTELTKDMLESVDGFQYMHELSSMMYYLGDFTVDSIENTYVIALTSEDSLVTSGRSLMQQYTFIDSVYVVDVLHFSPYSWLYGFILTPSDSSTDLLTVSIPELADFEGVYSSEVGVYCYTLSESSTDFKSEMESENLSSNYEKYLYMADYAEMILQNHSDILQSVEVEYLIEEIGLQGITSGTPVWQTAGDHNADGETNSNDAAALLVQAAEDGAAEASAETVSPDSDVNLDGVADATDAAHILQYSALKGAGMDPDWVEILKK